MNPEDTLATPQSEPQPPLSVTPIPETQDPPPAQETTDTGPATPEVPPEPTKRFNPTQAAIVLVILALVGYPLARWAMSSGGGTAQTNPNLPAGVQGALNASFALYQSQKYEEAITTGLAIVKDHPEVADAWNNLAASYGAMNRWDDAIKSAEEALKLNPNHVMARGNLDYARTAKANNGRPPQPNQAQILLNLSVSQYQSGKLAECIESAGKVIELEPKNAEAYNNRGACYAAIGMYDEAIQSEQEAIRLNPDNQLAKNNLAYAQGRQKLRDNIKAQK